MMAFMTKTDWINFYQTLHDRNKRGSLAWRIWRQSYLKMSILFSRSFSGYALHPLELNIETSSQCNLQCRMCPRRILDQEHSVRLDVRSLSKVMTSLKVRVLRFSGLGEPMMASGFWPIAESASNNGCKLAMVTNGTLIDEKNIKKISEMFSMVTVSLDSATAETYRSIRGMDAFERLYDMIKVLYWQREKNRMPLPLIAINWVLMRSNYKELPLLIRRFREDRIKIDLIHCDPLVPFTPAMHLEMLPVSTEGLKGYLEDVRGEALRAGIYLEYPYYARYSHEKALSENHRTKLSCNVLWESLFLTMKGEFMPCCEYYLNTIGSVDTTNPNSVWNSLIMRKARMRALQGVAPFSYCCNCHKYNGIGDANTTIERNPPKTRL